MVYFFVGCAFLVLLLLAGRMIASANPGSLAVAVRRIGGVAAIAAAGFLILRGALPIAIPLAVFGFSLLKRGSGFGFGDPFGSSRKAPGQKSRVKTDRLEVALDHDTGEMEGTCLAGRFEGRALVLAQRSRGDGASCRALPGGRAGSRRHGSLSRLAPARLARAAFGCGRGGKVRQAARNGSKRMSAEEAYAVLGLGPNASEEEIRQAHRRLMMKMHPDQGGSNYLAARINEAKDVLLGACK